MISKLTRQGNWPSAKRSSPPLTKTRTFCLFPSQKKPGCFVCAVFWGVWNPVNICLMKYTYICTVLYIVYGGNRFLFKHCITIPLSQVMKHEVRIFWSLDHGCLSNLQRCGSHGCGSHNSHRLPIPILGPVFWWQLKLFFWMFTPKIGEDVHPIWLAHIFSDGLVQPPTSYKSLVLWDLLSRIV